MTAVPPQKAGTALSPTAWRRVEELRAASVVAERLGDAALAELLMWAALTVHDQQVLLARYEDNCKTLEGHWTPVAEELPFGGEFVLFATTTGEVLAGRRIVGRWVGTDAMSLSREYTEAQVTHWRKPPTHPEWDSFGFGG